jgi:hypothetical protein
MNYWTNAIPGDQQRVTLLVCAPDLKLPREFLLRYSEG